MAASVIHISASLSHVEEFDAMITFRVVSPEISPGKFPEIYSNLSGKFREIFISGNFY